MHEWPFITYSKRNVLPPELWADPCGKEPLPSGCKNLQLFPLKHPLGVPKNLQNRCLSCSFTSLQSQTLFLMNENNLHLCIGKERKHVHVCFLCLSLPHVAKHSIINFCHIPVSSCTAIKKAYITMQKRRMGKIGILVDRSFCFQDNRKKNLMNTYICGFSFLWTETLWTNTNNFYTALLCKLNYSSSGKGFLKWL